MNALVINAFIDATLHVFEQIAGLAPQVQKPELKKESAVVGNVAGVIVLAGDYQGEMVLSFPAKSILQMVSTWFGEEMNALNEDIQDAVGEITNMICGQANQKFVECQIASKASLKEVLMGDSLGYRKSSTPGPMIMVPLELESGAVILEAGFSKKN